LPHTTQTSAHGDRPSAPRHAGHTRLGTPSPDPFSIRRSLSPELAPGEPRCRATSRPLCYSLPVANEAQFEEPIQRVRRRLEELKSFADSPARDREVEKLEDKLQKVSREIYENLTPWQKTLVARHPNRPFTLDYVRILIRDFVEWHGDRSFADDPAIVAGFGFLGARAVAVIGHQKGRDTREKIRRNFGMPRPEGYRKALRVMKLAEKFGKPVLSFIDTPGAFPGLESEERGVAEAIARNLLEMSALRTPIVTTVIGEGGSGGALGIGIGDVVLMLEHSVYSVISPEGCAAILWKDQARAKEAAEAMRLTAADCKALGVIDEVLPEPPGGAHADPVATIDTVGRAIDGRLERLVLLPVEALLEARYAKFRAMGAWESA
jgi:acetyl-CoA carboxylase carboxyl transferase subunit alpha